MGNSGMLAVGGLYALSKTMVAHRKAFPMT